MTTRHCTKEKPKHFLGASMDKWGFHDSIACLSLLVVVATFNIILADAFFPITDGWFEDWSRYIEDGLVPYRDFYLHIPPAFVYIAHFVNLFSDYSFLALRIYGIVERLLIVTIAFLVIRRIFKPWVCFIALVGASGIYTAFNTDVFFGYYHTALLFALLALYFCLRVFELIDEKQEKDSKKEDRGIALFSSLIGISCFLCFLSKQTTGLVIAIALLVTVTCVLAVMRKDKLLQVLICILAGILVGTVLLFIPLFISGAAESFVSQVFGGSSSKGSFFGVAFGFFSRITHWQALLLALLICGFFIFDALYKKTNKGRMSGQHVQSEPMKTNDGSVVYYLRNLSFLLVLSVFLFWAVWSILHYSQVHPPSSRSAVIIGAIIFLVCFGLYMLYEKCSKKVFVSLACIILAALLMVMMVFISRHQESLFSWEYIREKRQYYIYATFFFMIAYSIWIAVRVAAHKAPLAPILIISIFAWSFMYQHGMSFTLEEHSMLIPTALMIGLTLESFSSEEKTKIIIVIVFSCALLISSFCQKIWFSYEWWGTGVMTNYYESTDTYDDPLLKGLSGNNAETKSMNEIYRVIDDARSESKAETLYSFPHINYFNVMFDMDSPTFAKVHYFDVCPDDVASADADILLKEEPDFIVWLELSEADWTAHEAMFRNGQRSGQRDIAEAYDELTKSGMYELLGEYNIGGHSSPLYIWIKDNDTAVNLDEN